MFNSLQQPNNVLGGSGLAMNLPNNPGFQTNQAMVMQNLGINP